MPLMTWDATLDVGVREMNDEHAELLRAMNNIFDAHQAGVQGETINTMIDKLGKICVKHFTDEEAYMAKIGFPGVANHKSIHQKLLERFTVLAGDIKAAGGKADEHFFTFLKYWLSAHIRGIDMKYGQHSKAAALAKAG